MHDAYEPVPILEKLPLQIECLAAWGEFISFYIPTPHSHQLLCGIMQWAAYNKFVWSLKMKKQLN